MSRYVINFSSNASKVAQDIQQINKELAKTVRDGKKVTLDIDTANFKRDLDLTFRQLDNQIAKMQRKLARLPIGGRRFQQAATGIGITQGLQERGGMQARAIQLGAQAEAFDIGTAARLTKQLEAAKLEASQVAPNTQEWVELQRQIGRINADLRQADRLAESIQFTESMGAFAPGSLNALEAKLKVLRNTAREIAPNTKGWKELNREIQKVEGSIEKQTKRPLTGGQRLGAAGGAFLYGGGMGGGIGSALGGVAGGIIGGVPGAFAGAAFGQMADSIGMALSDVTAGAAAVAQLQRGLALASIDAKDFSEAQDAIRQSSDRLVVPIEQVYRQFTQLRVNTKQYGLTVKDTQQILEGVVLAVSATGGSLEDVDGAMRAVVQIFSKGSVQAEELRGQLGERFPGAVVKFAQANKLSFAELQAALEQGQVTVADFVNFAKKNYEDYAKFAEQLGSAPEFAGRRLEKAMNDMQVAVGAALGPAGALIQDFATQGIKDITAFVRQNKDLLTEMAQDFAGVFSAIVSTASEAGQLIVKVLGPAFNYIGGVIRQLKVMTGVAGAGAARAEMDAAFALMQKHGAGRARFQQGEIGFAADAIEYNKAAERYARAEKQFKAAGGSAALPGAQATKGLTFGGPGADIDLNQITGGKGGNKNKREKQLRGFENEAIAKLRTNQRIAQERLDQQRQLEIIDETEYAIASASNKRKYELLIIEEALAEKKADIGKYEAGIRGKQLAVFEQLAANERKLVEEEYKTAIKGAELKLSRPFKEGIRDENIEIEKQLLLMRNLRAGYSELTPEQEANLIIEEKTKELKVKQQKIIESEIEGLRQVTIERIKNGKALEREMELLKLRNQALQLRAPLGRERLVELMQTPGYTEEQAQAQFMLEEQNRRLQVFRQGASDLAGTINSSIGDALTNIATDFENLQQHGLNFIQTLANAFKQLANTIIQEMTRAMISKAVGSLFGFAMPRAGASAAQPGLTAGIQQYPLVGSANGNVLRGGFQAFANGGVVSGPTLGLIGEGRFNEAVVPLPDGRKIPVDLGGAAGSNISTNIVVNMNNGQASSQMTGNGGQALGRELEGAVRSVLLKESRPGGIIYSQR